MKILIFTKLYDYPFLYKNQQNDTRGLLLEPLKLFGNKVKCTFEFVDDVYDLQGLYGKNTNSSLFEELKDMQPADIIIATPVRFIEEYDYCKHTDIILYNTYFWVVPKPGLMLNIKVIASVFENETWILI